MLFTIKVRYVVLIKKRLDRWWAFNPLFLSCEIKTIL
jgi:hypothetical protein